jgi:hypothetical protein
LCGRHVHYVADAVPPRQQLHLWRVGLDIETAVNHTFLSIRREANLIGVVSHAWAFIKRLQAGF